MAESTSPKANSGDFAKKVQRQLSRGKEKVLQRLGKTVETRDDQFECYLQQFNDQQIDGNRMYKDLRNYVNAIRDMREASRRLSQSLFDVYETDWAGEEDLGAIVEEKVAKRGRKLVDYDSSRHHLEALQTAKKRDDVKINKAEEVMNYAKGVYECINSELKEELPVLYDSRIGCYVSVFSAVSTLRDIFYKEMSTLNFDLQNVLKELQFQHPDKTFAVKGMQRYGSLKRRTLMSPKAWKTSFSEFHKSYNPKPAQRFSFKSPDKPSRSTLSRESSTLAVSPQSPPLECVTSESKNRYAESDQSEIPSESYSSPAQEEPAAGKAGNELKSGEGDNQVEEEQGKKDEKSESKPAAKHDYKEEGQKAPPSDSSCELSNSCGSESLEMQLSLADNGPLHIEEREDSPVILDTLKPNGLENSDVTGFSFDATDPGIPHKEALEEKQASQESKSTVV